MARVPVTIPDLGESLVSVRILRWLKRVGDAVELDEPIAEITTDKIDALLPAPATGALAEIAVAEGAEVAVGGTIGTIATP